MSETPSEAPEPEQTPPPAAEAAEDDTTSYGRLHRLGVVGFVRVLIGLFGLGGFVVGVVVAVLAESATTLLIVSAILLVLAALGLDWNKIRGTYGGWTVELLRNFGERIEQVAASDEIPAAVREELEALKSQVTALTPAERPRRSRTPLPSSGQSMDALIKELMTTRATHSFQGPDTVKLSLRIASSSDSRYRCTIKTPTGHAYSAVTRRPISTGISRTSGPNTYVVTYPDEFEGSEPLTPGRYEVEWRSAPLVDPVGQSALLAALGQTIGPTVATDSFTIVDGVASGGQGETPRTPETP